MTIPYHGPKDAIPYPPQRNGGQSQDESGG